ncbi:MAG: hypothetical protein A4S09_04850 [Proteobacteria bacterium SG_bin7]|nr:MAG: hypothetical protein A4S09_04850 [Proteobacteria bacterium SG_bin7]
MAENKVAENQPSNHVGEKAQLDLNKMGVRSMADLLKSQPSEPSFLVDGLLPSTGISIIGGKPKDGKSTLIRNLIHAVATGGSFINKSVQKGSVLYLALEETDYYVTDHFRKMGVDEQTPIHTVLKKTTTADLRLLIGELKPALVVVDPLFLFIRVHDGNSYTEVYNAMGELNDIARDQKTHILTVHHIKKGAVSGPDSLLGSTALFGSVHTMMMFEAKGNDRVLSTRQKYGPHLDPVILKYDSSIQVYSYSGTEELSRVQSMQDEILSLIEEKGTCTHQEIKGSITGRSDALSTAIQQLVDQGLVLRLGNGTRSSSFTYKLPQGNGDCSVNGGVQ